MSQPYSSDIYRTDDALLIHDKPSRWKRALPTLLLSLVILILFLGTTVIFVFDVCFNALPQNPVPATDTQQEGMGWFGTVLPLLAIVFFGACFIYLFQYSLWQIAGRDASHDQRCIRLDPEDSLFNAIVAMRREHFLSEVEILAIVNHSGIGVPKDEKKAYDILISAAEQGNSNAFHYCQIAADAGHARGQYLLGLYYLDGVGVPADSSIALQLFFRAAEQGDADAQCQLGFVYRDALFGEKRDMEAALQWFNLAATQGDLAARWSLACHFAPDDGSESSQDRKIRILKEMAQEMSGDEKGKVDELLRWYEKHEISLP